MEKVDVISSGYEWVCPYCETLNLEIEYKDKYFCGECGQQVEANLPEHALG